MFLPIDFDFTNVDMNFQPSDKFSYNVSASFAKISKQFGDRRTAKPDYEADF